jgi:hypothetical protein
MKEENKNINYPRFIPNKPCGIDKFEGKSQERLTNAIANHIISNDNNNAQNFSRIIGLEGSWGVGKSNVIKQLEKHNDLKDNYYVFQYDAWGHQEDLQRRSFLETITKHLIDDKILIDSHCSKNTWHDKLNDLLARKITRIEKSLPKFNAGAFWTALFLSLTPVTTFIAERLENAETIKCVWLLVLIAFLPILIGLMMWGIVAIFNKEARGLGFLLKISKNENIETINTKTINEEEPTVVKFKSWMQSISEHIGKQNKKLIIVYDNMDRLPAEKVKELWSSIHTFFSEDGFENIWVIIPFDEKHLSCAFGESNEKEQLTKYFISKTFPVVYRVTPPIITDFKKMFNTLFDEAFGKTEDKQKRINSLFRLENPNATVRDTIEFINQLVSLKSIWQNEIDILYLAIFTLKRDVILLSSNIADMILAGDYLGSYIPKIITNNEILQKNISALVYGVSLDKSEQIPMSKYLNRCFNLEESADINRYAKSNTFIQILDDKIRNAEVAQTDNMIKCLSTLDIAVFSENNRKIISSLWKSLAIRKRNIPLVKQEFDSTYESLLLHTDMQTDILNSLCKQIQNFKEFNGKDYYTSLYQLNNFVEKQKIAFDVEAELQGKFVNSKIFLDYLIEAKEKYKTFKLITNESELDTYFTTLSPDTDTWKQIEQPINQIILTNYSHSYIIEILKNLSNDTRYKFDTFFSHIEQQLSTATAINFNLYFDAYKILSKEKPLKVRLNPTQRQTIWNVFASKQDTPEYLEIVAIQIANGTNTGGTFNNEQIKDIAEKLDYYANYGDLLINNLSWNIPVLNLALKYMTENELGCNLSLETVLPRFFDIKNNLNVTEQVLLGKLNDWANHKDLITKDNIQTIFQNIPLFFQFSKATKNTLTDYLNKTIIEALVKVPTDTLYQQRQQPNYYWNTVIKNLIDTDFLKSLPDNLTDLGKQYLDDIAGSRLAIPNANDIVYKLIEKLDRRETIAHIKDIRDKYCNSQYNINPQLFLYFESWFEKQGDLKQLADRATHKIIEPIINDTNCLNKIISKSNYYAEIINAAGDDATTFKTAISNKVQTSTDSYLITFAKKIGIEKEKEE